MLKDTELEIGDAHGQSTFNYRHAHIPAGQEAELLLRAFRRDFAVNGPSVVRIVRTLLQGWRRYKSAPRRADPRPLCARSSNLPVNYAGASGHASSTTATTRIAGS